MIISEAIQTGAAARASRTTATRACTAAIALLFASGCPFRDPEPCQGLRKGDRLQITIESQHVTENLPASDCHTQLDLNEGRVLEATIIDFPPNDPNECIPALAEFGPVGEWTWTEPEMKYAGGRTLAGTYAVQRGGCTGKLDLELTGSVPSRPPSSGQSASQLGIAFAPSSPPDPSCPQVCSTVLVISVERL